MVRRANAQRIIDVVTQFSIAFLPQASNLLPNFNAKETAQRADAQEREMRVVDDPSGKSYWKRLIEGNDGDVVIYY